MRISMKFKITTFSLIFLLFTGNLNAQNQPVSEKVVVMFGNSITYQGSWEKLLNRDDILNYGIPGYTTGQLIWTIKNVLKDHPTSKIWFIEGGINDISLGVPVKRIFENQKITIDSLKRNGIIPVMQLTIFKNGDRVANKQVQKLNKKIMRYCIENKIDYIDLNAFLSANGELVKEFTTDGCHLKEKAYLPWADAIKSILVKYKI